MFRRSLSVVYSLLPDLLEADLRVDGEDGGVWSEEPRLVQLNGEYSAPFLASVLPSDGGARGVVRLLHKLSCLACNKTNCVHTTTILSELEVVFLFSILQQHQSARWLLLMRVF